MLHELDDTTSLWLQDPVRSWREWPVVAATTASAAAQDKALASSVDADGLLEKVNEDKLARDVDDLSAIFEELADGVVDFPLPCDDDEEEEDADDDLAEATAAVSVDGVGEWIDGLDGEDAMNVDEISAAFDALVAEQEDEMSAADALLQQKDGASYSASEYDDSDSDMDDADDDEEDEAPVVVRIVPAPPVWASMAPLDPRSCIKTPVFKNLDARIVRISIPRMDLALGDKTADDVKTTAAAYRPVGPDVKCLSPVCKEPKSSVSAVQEYRHDPATCWICKSSKTPERKRALHRFLEKRSRRNWKKGPRYSGRSNVATSRVRNGGRFICTTQWI